MLDICWCAHNSIRGALNAVATRGSAGISTCAPGTPGADAGSWNLYVTGVAHPSGITCALCIASAVGATCTMAAARIARGTGVDDAAGIICVACTFEVSALSQL